jgi:hypothetical protein
MGREIGVFETGGTEEDEEGSLILNTAVVTYGLGRGNGLPLVGRRGEDLHGGLDTQVRAVGVSHLLTASHARHEAHTRTRTKTRSHTRGTHKNEAVHTLHTRGTLAAHALHTLPTRGTRISHAAHAWPTRCTRTSHAAHAWPTRCTRTKLSQGKEVGVHNLYQYHFILTNIKAGGPDGERPCWRP